MPARTRRPPARPPRSGATPARAAATGRRARSWRRALVLAAFVGAVAAAYQPAWRGGFLWDDDRHITSPALAPAEGLARIWFELGATQQYYPLVHSAFWVQHHLWGDDPLGYHLVGIGLHALSAFLLGLVLARLAVPGGWLAAAAFALHPVHVESVAWISELKNTLSGALYFGAALAWLRFDDTRSRRAWAASFGLFALALAAKTVTATLAAALLVVVWWRRGRIDLRRDAAPLAPFLALGAAAGLLTAWVERALIGARGAEFAYTAVERVLIAGRVVWFYLGKLAWPADLMFTYPRWEVSRAAAWQYAYPLALAALVAALWAVRRRTRAPLAAALVFCGTLAPVLGFFNVYPFRFALVADHFQYHASAAALALGAAGLARALARVAPDPRRATAIGLVAIGLPLGWLTWNQSRQYADAETLYRTTLARNPASWMAHNNLGMLLIQTKPDEALAHFREALRLKPGLGEARNNIGNLLHRAGRVEEALREYDTARRLEPNLAEAHNNACGALHQLGRPADAIPACETALALNPEYPEARFNLGVALDRLGRGAEAEASLRRAIAIRPGYADPRYHLGIMALRAGRFDEAAGRLDAVVRLRPDLAPAWNDLGVALERLGRPEEAAARFREAVRLRPGYADARFNLGNLLQGLGRTADAVAEYTAALPHAPADAALRNNLGVALESAGRLREAADRYREALALRPDFPEARANLARVLARIGRG